MSVFTSDVFLDAFAPAIGGTPVFGRKMWVVRKGPVRMAYCSPWNGFIEDPNLDELVPVAKGNGCWALTFTSSGLVADSRVEELSPVPTLIVSGDYSPSKKVRWSVRKATSLGFEVAPGSSSMAYPIFSSLWGKLKRGIPMSFYSKLEETGLGRTLLAVKAGSPVSALFYLKDEDGAKFMYSLATLEEFRRTQVTTLLVHEFLVEALNSNTPYVDLCGCTEESIYRFKSQFTDKVMFRPRYLHVLRKLAWKLVGWGSGTLYRSLTPSFIDDRDWKKRIVG